jgi:hypothetical protein
VTVPAVPVDRPFAVWIRGVRVRLWGRYPDRDQADAEARRMQRHGFDAVVRGPEDPPEK